jgi:hypothetical protein
MALLSQSDSPYLPFLRIDSFNLNAYYKSQNIASPFSLPQNWLLNRATINAEEV